MHLYTPVFDLTQLNKPVIEFDMKHYNYINMHYSIDGGATWIVLSTHNSYFSRWYSIPPQTWPPDATSLFDANSEPVFVGWADLIHGSTNPDNYHFCMDLHFLKNYSQV